MVKVQFFFRKDTGQIDGVFRGCKTESAKFKDPTVYVEVNVVDPPYEVTRNHKVILDADERIVGVDPIPNPEQPTPSPSPYGDLIKEFKDRWPTLTAAEKNELIRRALRRLMGE